MSAARLPSTEEASAYDRVAWQSFFGSQETGEVKSRVRILQVGEEQGIGVYETEESGLKVKGLFGVFLHCSQESSLPVSSTIVTCCGGDPTVSETVRETLWWKESLFGALGRDPDGINFVLRGKSREDGAFLHEDIDIHKMIINLKTRD